MLTPAEIIASARSAAGPCWRSEKKEFKWAECKTDAVFLNYYLFIFKIPLQAEGGGSQMGRVSCFYLPIPPPNFHPKLVTEAGTTALGSDFLIDLQVARKSSSRLKMSARREEN